MQREPLLGWGAVLREIRERKTVDQDDLAPVPCIVDEELATQVATMLDHLIGSDEVREADAGSARDEYIVVRGRGHIPELAISLTREMVTIAPPGMPPHSGFSTLPRCGSPRCGSTLRSWRTSLEHAVTPDSTDAVRLRAEIDDLAALVLAAHLSSGSDVGSVVVGRDEQAGSLRASILFGDYRWWGEYVDAPPGVLDWLGRQTNGHRLLVESEKGWIGEGCISTRKRSEMSTVELLRVLPRLPDELAQAALGYRPQP